MYAKIYCFMYLVDACKTLSVLAKVAENYIFCIYFVAQCSITSVSVQIEESLLRKLRNSYWNNYA